MNRHESCSFFPRKTGSQRKAKNVTGQRFFIQNHASSQNYLSRSSFWEFSKYEMLVKLKHIACWIEIPSFWLQALHSPQTFEMVWTKDEVDKYVVQVERNCKSAHEVSIFHSLLIGEISLHSFLYWPFLNCSVTWKGLPLPDCTEKLLTMRLQNGKFMFVIVNVAFCVPFPVRSTSHCPLQFLRL